MGTGTPSKGRPDSCAIRLLQAFCRRTWSVVIPSPQSRRRPTIDPSFDVSSGTAGGEDDIFSVVSSISREICKSTAFVDARTLRQEIRERRRRGALLLNSETGGSHPPIRISGQVTAAFRPSETSGTVLDPDAKRPKVTLQDIRWRRRIRDLEVSFGRSCLVWVPVPR